MAKPVAQGAGHLVQQWHDVPMATSEPPTFSSLPPVKLSEFRASDSLFVTSVGISCGTPVMTVYVPSMQRTHR
jgi:hypothetical protein